MKNLIWITLIFSLSLAQLACSKSKDNGGANPASNEDYLSYQIEDGCSTGINQFYSTSQESATVQLCMALKDNNYNDFCAQGLREMMYKGSQCPGVWPHSNSGLSSINTKSYSYRENQCSTGYHRIAGRTSRSAQRMYCDALMDDSLNQNCARTERQNKYYEQGCDNVAP